MARFVLGIIITTIYSIVFIVSLFKNDLTLGGIFVLFIIISIGVLLIIFGKRYINLRKTVVIHILKMLKESNGIDINEIVNRYKVTEVKVRKFLIYIQKKGILSTYCQKCKKEFPVESLESFISVKSKDEKPWLCPDCVVSMNLGRSVYKPKVLLKLGGATILVGFIHLFIGLAEKAAEQGYYQRAEISLFFIVVGVIFLILGMTIARYRCLTCNEKLGKDVLLCPSCGNTYDK